MANLLIHTLQEEMQAKIAALDNKIMREVKFPNVSNKIMVAIGMRRTGKTYYLLQTIEQLLIREKVPSQRILYINFEDNRLYPLTTQKLSDFLDDFYSSYPENHDQLCYLFLDEIQNIENWQLVIRRYFDTKKVKIYLTGSSAKLLSKEIATSLRGRSLATEIWPFSFTEFLQTRGISLPKTYGRKNLDKLVDWLKKYIYGGGLPEVLDIPANLQNEQQLWVDDYAKKIAIICAEALKVNKVSISQNFFDLGMESLRCLQIMARLKELGFYPSLQDLCAYPTSSSLANFLFTPKYIDQENWRRILQDYPSAVTLRDIIERYKITNTHLINYMMNFLLKNTGSLFSVNKFFKDLKSQGFAVSKMTVHDYLSYIEDAYLIFTVPIYSESSRKVQSNPRKIYTIDTGLASACNFGFLKNIGHYFENLIYLDLRRARHIIYYYLTKTGKEVDFLTRDPEGKWHLFQVCWDMENRETKAREISALSEAEEELKLKGECITPLTYFTAFLPSIRGHVSSS